MSHSTIWFCTIHLTLIYVGGEGAGDVDVSIPGLYILTAISNPVDVIKILMYVCNKYSMLNDLKLKLHVLVCSPNIAKGLIEFHCSCR